MKWICSSSSSGGGLSFFCICRVGFVNRMQSLDEFFIFTPVRRPTLDAISSSASFWIIFLQHKVEKSIAEFVGLLVGTTVSLHRLTASLSVTMVVIWLIGVAVKMTTSKKSLVLSIVVACYSRYPATRNSHQGRYVQARTVPTKTSISLSFLLSPTLSSYIESDPFFSINWLLRSLFFVLDFLRLSKR